MIDRPIETPGQMPLFNKRAAGEAREQAIQQVADNAHEEFMICALIAVSAIAHSLAEFTTDDVVAHMLKTYPEVTTHEPRALGAIMRQASQAGWIVNTRRVKASDMVSNHRRPKTVWASRLLA